MEPIFEKGYILKWNADRPIEGDLPKEQTVLFSGSFENCLGQLPRIQGYAGVYVSSFQEGIEAAKAGAAFVCPVYDPIEPMEEWKHFVSYVFPVCSNRKEAEARIDAGYGILWLETGDADEALKFLWEMKKTAPGTGFIAGGGFDPAGIQKLMPFYTVRAVCTEPISDPEEAIKTCKAAEAAVLGFEFAHLGINTESEKDASDLSERFSQMFGFRTWDNGNSFYASAQIECMKFMQLGSMGHIAIRSNSVERAKKYLSLKGLTPVEETARYRDGRLHNIYFKEEFGGFSIHLLQKIPADPS